MKVIQFFVHDSVISHTIPLGVIASMCLYERNSHRNAGQTSTTLECYGHLLQNKSETRKWHVYKASFSVITLCLQATGITACSGALNGDRVQPNSTTLSLHTTDSSNYNAIKPRLKSRYTIKSPDHNSIEYVWDCLGKAISQRRCPPRTPKELKVPLLGKWALLPQILIDTLIKSIGARFEALTK
ncbi:hypothetical protein TNCV_4915911 [Trichonephila clavipes]|nr:hypothetical protein TNCV_4915911 [Trichonephila clavipes]